MHKFEQGVIIAGATRTPFGKFGGQLRDFSLPDLGCLAVAEGLRRAQIAPSDVDEVALGVNLPGSDRSIARQVLLKAGIPEHRNAYTIDRACCSSLAAINLASRGLRLGDTRIAVAGGTENMSKVPYFVHEARWGHRLGDIVLKDQLVISCPHTGVPRAVQASNEALEFGVSRGEQDAWAVRSHQLAAAAHSEGHLADELVPIEVHHARAYPTLMDRDEAVRPETTTDQLAELPTIYGSQTVTAGNAPGLSTGASALVLMSAVEARRRDVQPLARIVSFAQASGDSHKITSIPAVAAQLALDRAELRIDDVNVIEINEAFAAVPLVTTLVLGNGNREATERLRARTPEPLGHGW
jgi:acetyl-CoA C-acetyltransferase